MKKPVKILLIVAIVPVFIFLTVVGLVYRNQDFIIQQAIEKINEEFVGHLELEDSHVAPFANFPYLSIDLENVKFYESKAKDTPPLYEASDLYLGFNLLDLIRGIYHIEKIKVQSGHLDVIRYPNGDINLLLAKGIKNDSTDNSESSFYFDLKNFILEDFTILYEEQSTGQEIVAKIGKLDSKIRISEDHLFMEIIGDLILDIDENKEHTFFYDKEISLDLEIDFDQTTQLLEITPSFIELQKSRFGISGTVDVDDDLNTNLKLEGQKPDFNLFAAFAPKEVGDALKIYQNEGDIYFIGTVVGKAGNGNTPAVNVEFGCENAWFLNTDVNKRVEDIRFTGFFTNGSSRTLETTEIQLNNFFVRPEEGAFEGTFVIRNFKDPYIKVDLHADLDLEFLSAFFDVIVLDGLKGKVVVDMHFNEIVDLTLPTENLAHLKEGIDSEITVSNLSFKLPNHPIPITNANMRAEMCSGSIILDTLHFRLGDSDIKLKGDLNDFPAIFHGFDTPVKASFVASSKQIFLKELLAFDKTLADSTSEEISDFSIKLAFNTTGAQLSDFEYLPVGEFFIEDFFAKLNHYDHTFHDFHADLLIRENNLELKDFSGYIDETDFHFSGLVENYTKWFQPIKKGDSSFEFDLTSDFLHPADLLTYQGTNYLPEEYRNEEFKDLKLHGKLDLHYDKTFKAADFYLTELTTQMKLHPLKLEKFAGRVHYEDEHLLVEDFSGKMGKSDFKVNLTWYTGEDSSLRKRDNVFQFTSQKLDLDALMNYTALGKTDKTHDEAFNIFELPFSDLRFKASVKELNYHSYWLEDFSFSGRMTPDHFIYLDDLEVHAADGKLNINGYFNGSNPEEIYFFSKMKAEKLDLDKLLVKFENFGQDHLINENLHGKVSGTIESKFLVYPDFTPIIDKSSATIELIVFDGSLVNFTPLQAMSGYFKDKNLTQVKFDTLQNTFELNNGVLNIPKMNINSSLGFIEIAGKQSLDLSMDYFLRIPLNLVTQVGFQSLFGGKKREEIDPDQEDAIVYRNTDKRVRFVNINLTGTPEAYKISLKKDKN
jgi:hypothetical protein